MSNSATSKTIYQLYTPSSLDKYYIKLARNYRLKMKPPEQSSFRVVSIITFKLIDQKTGNIINKLEHVIGCNIESTPIRASICGERCALFNLVARYPAQNFIIQTVYILTDANEPKCSGLLCLEFLSSFGHKSSAGIKFVNFPPNRSKTLTVNIQSAYPFPPIYKYLGDRKPTHTLYKEFSKLILQTSNHKYIMNNNWPKLWKHLYLKCIQMSKYDKKSFHPLSFGGGVLFENNQMECCWMSKALEYSASIECVSKLLHTMEMERLRNNKAVLLMIVDDYGILHAPNGIERTSLIENGFGEIKVVVHFHTDSNPLYYYQHGEDFTEYPRNFDIFVRKVTDIVPAPPNTDMLQGFVENSRKSKL